MNLLQISNIKINSTNTENISVINQYEEALQNTNLNKNLEKLDCNTINLKKNFLKLLILATELNKGNLFLYNIQSKKLNKFDSDENILEFIKQNKNLSFKKINNLFQRNFLVNFKNIKLKRFNNLTKDIENFDQKSIDIFSHFQLTQILQPDFQIDKTKNLEFRLLGSNNILLDLSKKVLINYLIKFRKDFILKYGEKEHIKYIESNKIKIYGLSSAQINNSFGEDDEPENKVMDKILSEIKEQLASKKIKVETQNFVTTKRNFFGMKKYANTIDTIKTLERDNSQTSDIIIYVGLQPFLKRQSEDIKQYYEINKISLENVHYLSSNYEQIIEHLKQKYNEYNKIKSKFQESCVKFMYFKLLFLYDQFARMEYGRIKRMK